MTTLSMASCPACLKSEQFDVYLVWAVIYRGLFADPSWLVENWWCQVIFVIVHLLLKSESEDNPVNLCTVVVNLNSCIAVTNLNSGTFVIVSVHILTWFLHWRTIPWQQVVITEWKEVIPPMIGAVVRVHAVTHRFVWVGVSVYLWYAGLGKGSSHEGECRNTIKWPEKCAAGLLRKDNVYCIQIGLQLHLALQAQFDMRKSVWQHIRRVHLSLLHYPFTLQVILDIMEPPWH